MGLTLKSELAVFRNERISSGIICIVSLYLSGNLLGMKLSDALLVVATTIVSLGFAVSVKANTESVVASWHTASSGQRSGTTMGGSSIARAQPDAGTTVPRLRDLVGARAGQAENAIRQRGYRFVKTDPPSGDAVYSYWLESRTNYCVTIRTEQGRYQSIVYTGGSADCNISSNTTGGNTSRQPDAGTTVSRLRDLVGARAGQAENALRQRGYRFVKADNGGYTYWLEGRTNYCVTILTDQGRYQSIVYTGGAADCQK